MKICYIADAGNIHTQRWVNYFARRGHEVHLISYTFGEGYLENVRFHLLPTLLPRPSAVSGYINSLTWSIKVRRLVRRIKPDVIDAHYITIYGYLAIASGFQPVVLTAWGSDILIAPKRKRLYRFLTKYALRKAKLVICDSETVRKELIKLRVDVSKIRIIYNGIDTQKFSPQRGKEFKNRLGMQGAPIIISDRRLGPIYNVEVLIRAIPLILEHAPQTSFIIAGDGEQRGYLASLVSSLGVSDNVRLIGWISHDELPNYLASSDIYVSTSLSDSTSLSLQEAMACELAPVVTNLPANREWITDGENGFLVPVKDIQALTDRIIYLIKNEEIRAKFGREGRKIIKQRAEYEEEMGKVEELYQQLVNK